MSSCNLGLVSPEHALTDDESDTNPAASRFCVVSRVRLERSAPTREGENVRFDWVKR
jgi:hypothetical protein